MKSLILTVLYLAKDTVHRWATRLSSPVARVLVVFFLSLCALCFLGTYVISAKAMRERIREQGGDLVHLSITAAEGKSFQLPSPRECEEVLGAESLVLRSLGYARNAQDKHVVVSSFDFSRMGQMWPYMAPGGTPTLVISRRSTLPPGPSHVMVEEERVEVFVRRVPDDCLLSRLLERVDMLLLPPDSPLMEQIGSRRQGYHSNTVVLRARDADTLAGVERVVQFCQNYLRLEGAQGYVSSAQSLLREMEIILSNQVQCRVAFCLGIACIVGILLTALASMEYRQNEYIYTLMKSFGIHPLLLVATFIVENLLLVGASFVGAVWVFMQFQRIIVRQFFKTGNYSLSLAEITPELQLIAVSLLGCVLISCIPIIFAANRDIGRVLK